MDNLSSVKLIATDMDGTLLDAYSKLPPNFYSILDQLDKHHIYLAIATGRSYNSLMSIFRSPYDNLIFICENGAHIVEKDETIYQNTINTKEFGELIRLVRQVNDSNMVLACEKYSYIENTNPVFFENISIFFKNIKIVDDLTTVNDQCYKLCLFDYDNVTTNLLPKIQEKIDTNKFTFCSGATNWLDIMDRSINKGVAIRKLQQIMDIKPEETMVFGDHMNDFQMMQQAYYSFAMDNAIPAIKEIANFVAPDHQKKGVMQIIEQLLSKM